MVTDTKKQPAVALLPSFDHYVRLSVEADIFALRLDCQIDCNIRNNRTFVFLDGYIGKDIGQEYNNKSVHESLNHQIGQEGDCSQYKGLSLIDIDHAGVYCSVFLHCYREALAFLSLISRFTPSKVVIAASDPNLDIFSELARQVPVEMQTVSSLGTVDEEKSNLIKKSNRGLNIQSYDWFRSLKQPIWKRILTGALNLWAISVRVARGKKPFIYMIPQGQLSGISAQLSLQKPYFPVFSTLTRLPFINMIFNGSVILQKQYAYKRKFQVTEVIEKYKKYLKEKQDVIGQLEIGNKRYSIANSIISRLHKHVERSFNQIANDIDIHESFLRNHRVAGALLSSDMNWDRRMIVRLFQKHKISNMVLMNGWFGTKHMIENKTVDKVLCFGDSYAKNYFEGKADTIVTGASTFDSAFKKRASFKPSYPIRKILVSTFTFSLADINCRYSDSEKYLIDILSVINKYQIENNIKIHIDLRPHPSDEPAFYRWNLEKLGFSGIDIKNGGKFKDIVIDYDLYFASYSTTVFESAAMGIPVIFYHPCNQILYPPFDGSCAELPSAISQNELEDVFIRVMRDEDYAYRFTHPDVLRPYVGDMDGNAASRIINETIRMTCADK